MKVNKTWGGWNLFEIVWLVLFTSIAVAFTVISKDSLFDLRSL